MRFSLSPDQVALRDAVRDLLAQACPPAVVRAAWDPSYVDTLWTQLADMGLFGAAVPETQGGLGLDDTDLLPVFVELGYAAVPLPVAETMLVAPLLGPGERLDQVLGGRLRIAIAGAGGLARFGGRSDLVASLTGQRLRLAGPGPAVPLDTVDGSLALTRPDLSTGEPLTADASALADRVALADAAQLLGLARRMLDLTTSYVVSRRQFGVPVGSFQAVKHRLADALLRLEFAVPAVLAAGWALAHETTDPRDISASPGRSTSAGRDVSLAVVLATEAAQDVAKAAIQCHGAIGYTVEYDLHLYAKRAWALAANVAVDDHLARLADALDLKGTST